MMLTRALLLVASVLLTLASSGSAFAHASLLHSEPVDGSILSRAPNEFVLTFNESVAPTIMRLVEPDGSGTDLRGVKADGQTVTITLPTLGRGTHALSWRVISADSHPVGGAIVFSIGAASGGRISVRSQTPLALAGAIWITRVLLYLGLFIGVGGTFFHAWIGRDPARPGRRIIDATLLLGLLSSAVSPALQGADALGLGLAESISPHAWVEGATSTFGLTVAVAACAMVLALIVGRTQSLWGARLWSLVALLGIGFALAASGHASDAPPQWLTRPAVFLHTVAIAIWVGALAPLGASLKENSRTSAQSLSRFSFLIPVPLAVLVAAGFVLATIQVEEPQAILATGYGRVLAAKLFLVVILLGLGAWNRWRLTDDVTEGRAEGSRLMFRLIGAEAAIALAIFGLVATWRFTPPPRALAAALAAQLPAHTHIHTDKAMADVTVTPGHVGPVSISVSILNGELGALNAQEVDLELSNPAAGIEPIHVQARHVDGAAWRADHVTIPAPGKWNVRVAILLDEFTEATLEGELTISR